MNVNAVFRKVGFHNIEIFKICLIFSENFSYLQEQISIFLITKANESFNFCRYLSLTETLGNCIYQSLFTKKKYNQIVTNSCVCVCVCACVGIQELSRVQLFANPWTVACQAPLSMEFFRQKYWSGLPFLTPRNFPIFVQC